jgi:hypothetical protein
MGQKMAHLLSSLQPVGPASSPAHRVTRVVVVGGAGLAALLLAGALILWLRYGTTVFFEMVVSGFAACF